MDRVGVIGGGTMGAGIAQVAAAGGCKVQLMEIDQATAEKSIAGIKSRFDRLLQKGRMTPDQAAAATDRLHIATAPDHLAECELIIEAIVENIDVKVKVLTSIRESVEQDAIFASNTSSLSISELGRRVGIADRLCGMHFFNPAPLMPLVEVIRGEKTSSATVDRVADIATRWGKSVVRAADTPGFIVNRVARPFYLEALRLLEEKFASCETIDRIMRDAGGFRMGPFQLMDLVGIDVNYAVTRSVYEQSGKPARFTPSAVQAELVERGELGRKTGVGFYDYRKDEPVPAYHLDTNRQTLSPALLESSAALSRAGGWKVDGDSGYVVARILCALMNEAALAEQEGVASEHDIDLAMKLGTNYPKGLLAWAGELGHNMVGAMLKTLNDSVDDGRFAAAKRFAT